MQIDKNSPISLHHQLYEYLKSAVDNGDYEPNQMIPSESELYNTLGISRTTVRNAITQLVNEKVLYRVPGKGTFVAEPKLTTMSIARMGIREQLEDMGYQTNTSLLEKKIDIANKKIAKKLKIPAGSQVYVITRVRNVSGVPLSLHTTYLPLVLCKGLLEQDLEKRALCDILEEDYNVIPKWGEETLESVLSNSTEAEYLNVGEGSNLLYLECTMYSVDNIPYELAKVVFRGDAIKLKFRYDRLSASEQNKAGCQQLLE
jgi:GntR family transcriptional regulator